MIIAIIPARGGSKRLPRKNIYPIWGKPLLHWSIKAALDSKRIDAVWVTTEDDEIAEVALRSGANLFKRNPKFSEDSTYKMVAIRNCFNSIEFSGSAVVSLQANSPEITGDILDEALDTFFKYDRNELISVDKDLMMNAAFRIMRPWYVNQRELSTKTGVFICDVHDVHTIEDIRFIEERTKK
jgi:CMP-N,N'-diacetyllegionaminic acid synthase